VNYLRRFMEKKDKYSQKGEKGLKSLA